ncbi:dihydroxyacetone kinase subunit DhaL [Gryllotalpicola ginsengisoli]|uniref:dihydroxyacetone kinase subunit DhaL n=1 Tax=Gryllotalpicola ginsengisoli TaxID=444608 RepID=UPI0003B4588A|nr:dihydroxyacetone kinase subunit DhaL [Gryllotalpicola ginsengisoli]
MAETTIGIAELTAWLRRFRELVGGNRGYLTELDSAIGDADHGANMDRGMAAVVAKLEETPAETADDLFKRTGMTLVSTVGGASGPLYGTFFLRLGTSLGAVAEADATAFGAALRAGLEGVVQRGKAEAGDKTMYDALAPALEAYDGAVAGGSSLAEAAHAALEAAAAGRDATVPLVARKGRASYLGERSAGHLDPGATSATLLFQALDDTLAGK